jgi:hypothetical protein
MRPPPRQTTPITASATSPAWMAARNTKYLAKKPASGGMPASENISMASTKAIGRLVRARPARSAISSTAPSRRRMASTQPKVPSVMTR